MVEVPDYLLQRSRERRAALGAGGTGGGPTPSAGEGGVESPSAATPATVENAEAPAVAPETAPVPAVVERPPPPPLPTSRTGIPGWMLPVLAILPLWLIVYMGAFGETSQATLTPEQQAPQLYATNCAVCHGARGEGGVGPKLSGEDSELTFPNEADHIAWVETGSSTKRGQPYGDPARPGGQRVAASGGMPAFSGTLTPEQIRAVVTYERTGLQ